MSSNRNAFFGFGTSQDQGYSGYGNPRTTRGHTQNWRTSQLQSGYGSQFAGNLNPSEMIKPGKLFVRGMRLEGYGFDALRKSPRRNGYNLQPAPLYHESGRGTFEDPTVAWLQNQDQLQVSHEIRQAEYSIARRVAKANGFQCVLIRKGVHDRECTFNAYGQRNTFVTATGNLRSATTPSDSHITVWMGERPDKILVGGHIYVIEGMDHAGRRIPQLMNHPASQRNPYLVQPGRGMVAEEFWLVNDVWEKSR